jgi:hypothetical protein
VSKERNLGFDPCCVSFFSKARVLTSIQISSLLSKFDGSFLWSVSKLTTFILFGKGSEGIFIEKMRNEDIFLRYIVFPGLLGY